MVYTNTTSQVQRVFFYLSIPAGCADDYCDIQVIHPGTSYTTKHPVANMTVTVARKSWKY